MIELISSIPLIGGFLSVVVPFIFVLLIVVYVHEMGHYLVGRWCGIHAETFSLGMGPVLASRIDKHGTKWQLAAIPIGGLVKFLGDADGASTADHDALADMDASTRSKTFHGASVLRRALTVAAGPVFNFILSILVFGSLLMYQGTASEDPVLGEVVEIPGVDNPLRAGDRLLSANGQPISTLVDFYDIGKEMAVPGPLQVVVLRDGAEMTLEAPYPALPLIYQVVPFSAASRSDIQSGDFITAIDGVPISSFNELLNAVETSDGKTLNLDMLRDGERISVALAPTPEPVELEDGSFTENWRIGVSLNPVYYPEKDYPGPIEGLKLGTLEVYNFISSSLNSIKHIFLGNLGADNLQGPIGIAQISGAQAEQGLVALIYLIGFISTAIGLINLFPVPVLDGGHLCFFAYEAVAGRPPSQKAMNLIMPVGLAMVLLLMLFATYNDLVRLATQFMS